MSDAVPAGPLRVLIGRLAAGESGPAQIIEDTLDSIARDEPDLHAWAHVDAGLARQTAAHLGAEGPRGPLWGVPIGVKDLIDVAGMPTRCGSDLTDSAPAARDASCVARLRVLGAVPIGKTVTTEFGYFQPGPTRNPNAPGHTPGGSSSGSAAAVAAGTIPAALGTQTAGSLTRPASFCGVAGLVTTHGDIDTSGITGLSPSLDTVGLLARTVDDLYLFWNALRHGAAVPPLTPSAPRRLRIWRGTELGDVSSDMAAALTDATVAAATAGVPHDDAGLYRDTLALNEFHHTVMAYEAVRERAAEAATPDRVSAPFAELLRAGADTSAVAYRDALDGIAAVRARLLSDWTDDEFVLGPAALGAAPPGLSATGSPVLSRPWQALGLPVVTVPGRRDPQGLPLGLQLVGRPGSESRLLAAAAWLESVG
ncbi:Asp-tRNA(Asn)/Glu-tRNA(Gln) amidotransferase A subunit family amidase [Rhodococcus sp. LBL1]|nr:Asp-tRNA(Asn)/Glu-tRNA(Gln) amidotransferase A subunit family amidase [Rhodococcus sp. LBL1]MDH6683383.1 Asp-tRNA(Asn)/Glu-tRNA(Gln) amidotransferase A subunit family amidase [Rhodococcus sp. LBL2]